MDPPTGDLPKATDLLEILLYRQDLVVDHEGRD